VTAGAVWDHIIGQDRAVDVLRRAAERPVHAYLLAGPAGSGLEDVARALAASLLCPNGGDGDCSVCRRVLAGRHPDSVEIEPEGTSILREQAADIVESAVRSPFETDRKVIILFEAERMNETAENKLLKTFEEPPPTTVFVLVTSAPDELLPTVLSRCQRIDLHALTEPTVAAILERERVLPADAEAAARLAGGRLDRARLLAGPFVPLRSAFVEAARSLTGTGAAAGRAAASVAAAAQAAVATTTEAHRAEREALEEDLTAHHYEQAAINAQVRRMKQRHDRRERRARTDALMEGLAAMESVYRDALVSAIGGEVLDPSLGPLPLSPQSCLRALDELSRVRTVLVDHSAVNEGLLMEHLLFHLPAAV
jgi:DNA polymerase-3 subunit delta'